MAASVLAVASRALLETCRRMGLDADRLASRAGLTPEMLADPDARIPADLADGLWREALTASGDRWLALHAAEHVPFGAFRVLDFLAASGTRLGDGLSRVCAYFRLVDPRGLLSVEEEEDRARLCFDTVAGGAPAEPAQQFTFALFLLRARAMIDEPFRPLEVCFTFPSPSDPGELSRVFGVIPTFDCARAALVFPRRIFDLPPPSRNPGLFSVLDEHARALLERVPLDEALVTRVRLAIAAGLNGEAPTLARLARQLGLSPRSLQRKLESDGTSFVALLDEVRHERADLMLRSPDVAVSEVSWVLGFSEQSAFTRAFKRWTGRSPQEFRRGLRRAS